MKQLVSILPDGTITGLEMKKGSDIKQLGTAEIVRSSLVEWVPAAQAWQVRLLHGKHAGVVQERLTWCYDHRDNRLADIYWHKPAPWWLRVLTLGTAPKRVIPLWRKYEDAVAMEIEIIQNMRLEGIDV